MSIHIRLFASLREKLGHSELSLDIEQDESDLSIAQLRASLSERGPEWSVILEPDVHAAINQQMAEEHQLVMNGDEVAFFPPVTGG